MIFIGYPRCSTSNRAQAWLDSRGVAYTFRHIRDAQPDAEELRAWIARSSLPIRRFFNTSGMLYRAMGLKDKLPSMTEAEQLALLSSDGLLVRRPILVTDAFVLVGFNEAQWTEALNSHIFRKGDVSHDPASV